MADNRINISTLMTRILRNLLLMLLVAGGLHLYLYRFGRQGKARKYDARDLAKDSGSFTGRSQLLDNMFWSCAGGVTVWSAYEVLYLWAAANGQVPHLDWGEHPIWFALWFLIIPVFESMHFYWVHRLLHWRPLYRAAHALHHRNVNTGPWSGISMHPLEHVIYFSVFLLFWVVPVHPMLIVLCGFYQGLSPAVSHCGFERLRLGRLEVPTGDPFHNLHHRHFEVNYGMLLLPLDKWFGTFHDGSLEAHEQMKDRRRASAEVGDSGA